MEKKISIIHYIITALLIFGFQFLPPFGEMTSYGMGILGTFLGAVYGWSFINMIWPSLVALFGLGLQIGMPTMLANSFGNPAVAMMFAAFPMMAVLSDLHITELLANKFLTNKLALGRPWVAIILLFLGAYATAFINSILSILIFATFVIQLCKKLEIPPYSKFPTTVLMGLAYSIMLGQIIVPFFGTGLMFTAAYNGMFHEVLSYAQFMLFIIPLGIAMVFMYVLVMRFILRVDVSPLKKMTNNMQGSTQKMSRDQKLASLCFVAFIVVLLLSSVLPVDTLLYKALSKTTIFGIAIIFVVLMMILKREDGKPLLNYTAMAAQGFAWEPFFLTAYVMVISSYLTSADTGLNATIASLVTPMTQLPPMLFIVSVLLFAAIVTNIANNVVLAIIIMPILHNFASMVGIESTGLILLLFISTQLALATPGASPITGIACAQSEIVKSKDFAKTSLIILPTLFIITLILGIIWMKIVF